MKKLKRIAIIVIIGLGIFSFISAVIGLMFILYKLDIIKMEDITGAVSSTTIDTNVTDVGLKELMSMSDAEVWQLLVGRKSQPRKIGSIAEKEVSSRITKLTVKVRTKKGDAEKSVQVNKALVGLFTAFFNDLYNECPDFYISSIGGYCFRANVNSPSNLSIHSFGAAIDINASYNGNGKEPPSKKTNNYVIYKNSPMVEIAKKYTLCWGGYFSNTKDGMHFSFIGDWTRKQTLSKYSS